MHSKNAQAYVLVTDWTSHMWKPLYPDVFDGNRVFKIFILAYKAIISDIWAAIPSPNDQFISKNPLQVWHSWSDCICNAYLSFYPPAKEIVINNLHDCYLYKIFPIHQTPLAGERSMQSEESDFVVVVICIKQIKIFTYLISFCKQRRLLTSILKS